MKDRIRQLQEAHHMAQNTFANILGIAPATLSNIYNEKTKPTLNIVDSIKSKFPHVNVEWLMYGTGKMFLDEKDGADDHASSTPQGPSVGAEPSLFDSVEPQGAPATPQRAARPAYRQPQQPQLAGADIVYKDPVRRKITEIRVFYDDQTFESFVPKK